MDYLINVSGFGKLSPAPDPKALLLMVFGGVDVESKEFDGIKRDKKVLVASGNYMWRYLDPIGARFRIFVAVNHHVNGNDAYDELMEKVQAWGFTPCQKILYLFSAGCKPGMLLLQRKSPDLFESIYLVDIYLGGGSFYAGCEDFYRALVDKYKKTKKITYVYTEGGAGNEDAREHLKWGSWKATSVVPQNNEDGMQTHVRTNEVAIGMLKDEVAFGMPEEAAFGILQ